MSKRTVCQSRWSRSKLRVAGNLPIFLHTTHEREPTNTMKRAVRIAAICLLGVVLTRCVFAQPEKVDTAVVAKIKFEGIRHSQIMDLLSSLCDVYSPRLAWSPEYRRGAEWVTKKLGEWGISNVTYDYWAPLGKGWTLRNFSAMVTSPVPYPLIAYPAAWSPGLKEREAEVLYLDATKADELEKYKGKLKGKFVLVSEPIEVKAHFEPQAGRLADSVLLRMANADMQQGRRGLRGPGFNRLNAQNIDSMMSVMASQFPGVDTAAMRRRFNAGVMGPLKLAFAQQEGALARGMTARFSFNRPCCHGRGRRRWHSVLAHTTPKRPRRFPR